MTPAAKLTALATLPLTAATALFWALLWPVAVGLAAHWVLGGDSGWYQIGWLVCVAWGAWRAWIWWLSLRVAFTVLTRPTRRRRHVVRVRTPTRRRATRKSSSRR